GIGCVVRLGSKESDGVIAPIVGELLLQKMPVIDESVDGHQLNGSNAKRFDVSDDLAHGEPGEGAAALAGDRGMHTREAANMQFVKNGVIPGNAAATSVTTPTETGVDDDALRNKRAAIAPIERQI